jgi:hypothetical protein
MKITIHKENIINQLLENTSEHSMSYTNNKKTSTVQASHLTDRPVTTAPGSIASDSTSVIPKVDPDLSKRRQYAGFDALRK